MKREGESHEPNQPNGRRMDEKAKRRPNGKEMQNETKTTWRLGPSTDRRFSAATIIVGRDHRGCARGDTGLSSNLY